MKSSWSKDIFVDIFFAENLLSPEIFSTKGVFDEVDFWRKNSVPQDTEWTPFQTTKPAAIPNLEWREIDHKSKIVEVALP